MQMIGHEHCRKNSPIFEFADSRLKCVKCRFICQNPLAIRHANRDEVNDPLFPS